MALPASDNFNRANENPLAGNWTTQTGANAMQLSDSTRVRGTVTGYNAAYWNADAFGGDHYSQIVATIVASGNSAFPCVRMQSGAASAYYVRGNGAGTVGVYKIVNGTITQLGSNYALTVANGDTLKISITGSVITISHNGVPHATTQTDSALTGGSAGVGSGNTARYADDWTGGDVAASGKPATFGGSLQYRGGSAPAFGGNFQRRA